MAAFISSLLTCSSVAPASARTNDRRVSAARDASLAILNSTVNTFGSRQTTADVIVIGAGIAGLAAAADLSSAGRHVIVLEARARIGGRTWTNKTASGVAVDMGALWMHGVEGNPIWDLAQEHLSTAVTHATDYKSVETYYEGGEIVPEEELSNYNELFTGFEDLIDTEKQRVKDAGAADLSLQAVLDKFVCGKGALSGKQRQGLTYNVGSIIESEYAADIGEMSATQFMEDLALGGGDRWFENGYVQVADHLARGLDIRLSAPVKGVSYNSTGVSVMLKSGATFTAPHVIVTVPLGVLKRGSIAFSPPLPAAKLAAIAALGMGLLDKVALVFNIDEMFWDGSVEFIDVISTRKGEFCRYYSLYYQTKQPVLVAYNEATYAHSLKGMTDAEVVAAAMAQLRSIYGPAVPEPKEYHITRWSDDPFAGGAYSFWATNSSQADNDRLAEPIGEGRVLFAGEATSDVGYFATVHGAYWSGQREAQRVLNGFLTGSVNGNGDADVQHSPQAPGQATGPRAAVPAASIPTVESVNRGAGHSDSLCVLLGMAVLHSWPVGLAAVMQV